MRGCRIVSASPVAGHDGLVVGFQESSPDRDRHQPQRAGDQIDVAPQIGETPAKTENALDKAGLDEGALAFDLAESVVRRLSRGANAVAHPLHRRHFLG